MKIKKPFILRYLPRGLRQRIASRIYLNKFADWRHLYDVAAIEFCPNVSMYNLYPGDVISDNIAFNGFYELELSREIAKLSQKGALFVDIGANMGYFSLLWAGLNPHGHVISYEAAPRNIELIKENIIKNNFSDRIMLVPKAAGHESGTANFTTGPIEQTGWGGISNKSTKNTIEVPVVRLDDELKDSIVDVLKIDVEGADTWVLYGCEKLLKEKRIKRIFFEQNDIRMAELGIGVNEAVEFLRSVGYTCIPFGPHSGEWVSWPVAKPV